MAAPLGSSWSFLVVALLTASTLPAQQPAAATPPAPSFDRDVRPILADRCFKCHGPDDAARQGKLRLDERTAAIAARRGRPAIVPGSTATSELWHRISSDDADEVMPPHDSGKARLSADERAIVRAWIDGGAVYEPHWSFVPPVRPAVPTVRNAAWCRTPVDAFVLHELEQRGLAPSPLAEPEHRVRRLFLLLTGLPPEPADVAAFTAAPSQQAWDALVDRLFTTEPWRTRIAEHRAQAWLDAARYADTSGIHMDAGRQMWAWRDWLLTALRDNMPLDRFVTEQLAGDLLPDATADQVVASGFHRNHVTTDEGGAIDAEYLVEYAVDRTATTGSVFLGLTIGCARCHEHKFDPISHEDFYRVFAYFNSIDEPGLYTQEKDSNRAFEPFLRVPTAAQQVEERRLQTELAAGRQALAAPPADETAATTAWFDELAQTAAVQWPKAEVARTHTLGGTTMTPQADGSLLCSGSNPARDRHEVVLRTEASDLRLLCLEALPDPSLPHGKVGRAPNGNAVLQAISVRARSVLDPSVEHEVPLHWAWASIEQDNGDHRVVNALRSDDGVGWAVDAHNRAPEACTALFLAAAPFGFAGGTEVTVALDYDSIYGQHAFGRVRLSLGAIATPALELLPEALGGWHRAGPFPATGSEDAWADVDGPEQQRLLDRSQRFPVGTGKAEPQRWQNEPDYRDGRQNELPEGTGRIYLAQEVYAPSPRQRPLRLGSDDGFRLYLDGREVAGRQIDRALAADQDEATVALAAGQQLLVLKVVNTGGQAGFYVQRAPRAAIGDRELDGDLIAALLPEAARQPLAARLQVAWRERFSADFRARRAHVAELERQLKTLDAEVGKTMVMRERKERRPTYVLDRGEYDKPLMDRPVQRGVPAALGALPAGAPDNRLGLAQWLCSEQNPLFLRVQANRLFELVFGTGLVRTSEDFGMQGEWPSHRELLDWLAIELRESGFDTQHVLRLLCKSAVFSQHHRVPARAAAVDPDNRLLSWFSRRRLSAEQLRDQALFTAGLLQERLGGPSVKPYQPKGLWQEVAMLGSNTREFVRGDADELWRRSLYTYYKRACPPPNMLTFDAPTREFCTIRRLPTNTPLQALVLWNDEQYVEAARALAQRSLDAGATDRDRLASMFVRCTAVAPDARQLEGMLALLHQLRARYAAAPDDAKALLSVGASPLRTDVPASELAAWTLLASAMQNLDATLCTP